MFKKSSHMEILSYIPVTIKILSNAVILAVSSDEPYKKCDSMQI